MTLKRLRQRLRIRVSNPWQVLRPVIILVYYYTKAPLALLALLLCTPLRRGRDLGGSR